MRYDANQAGMTLIEVMVIAGSISIIVLGSISVAYLRGGLTSRLKSSQALSEVMMLNVTEIKAKAMTYLPKDGECVVRKYNRFDRKFISQTKVSSTSLLCGKSTLAPDVVEVIWKGVGSNNIDLTFNPSTHLKLPLYKTKSILQIDVTGRVTAAPPGPPIQTLDATIFRK